MQEFCVRGVVRGGQVVLEAPLDLPDGTVVRVAGGEPNARLCSGAEKRRLLTLYNRLDLLDDPDWWEKSEADRLAHIHELIRDAAELRARHSAGSVPSAGPERP
jgi:hypothetical protein